MFFFAYDVIEKALKIYKYKCHWNVGDMNTKWIQKNLSEMDPKKVEAVGKLVVKMEEL